MRAKPSATFWASDRLPRSAEKNKSFNRKTCKNMINQRQIGLLAAGIISFAGLASAQAQATAPAPDPDPTGWKSSAAAGLTLTRGNSSTLLATLNAATAKKWEQNELSFGADATYGESKIDGTQHRTSDSLQGFGQYNRLFNERLYGYLRLDGLHDQIADMAYRLTLAPGVGYYLIKEKKTD